MRAGGMRWSYSERAWLGVFETRRDGRIFCAQELTWYHKAPEVAAVDIAALKLDYVVAQAALFPSTDEPGETVSETFTRGGVAMRCGSDDRLAIWSRLRSWLTVREWPDRSRGPALLIHPSCTYLIDSIPALVKSQTEPDDVDETPDEYPAFGTALFAMSRPSPWIEVPKPKPIDPLSAESLWKELWDSGGGEERYVGWNRHSGRIRA